MSSPRPYPDLPPSLPPAAAPPTNHGRTLAAWVLLLLSCVGAVVVAIGFVLPSMIAIWVGVGVVVIGLVASVAMRIAGLGQARTEREHDADDEWAHLRSSAPTQAR